MTQPSQFRPALETLEQRNPPSLFSTDTLFTTFVNKERPNGIPSSPPQKTTPALTGDLVTTDQVVRTPANPPAQLAPEYNWDWTDFIQMPSRPSSGAAPAGFSCLADAKPQIVGYEIYDMTEGLFFLSGLVYDDTVGDMYVDLSGDIYALAGVRLYAGPAGGGWFYFGLDFGLQPPDPGGAVHAVAMDACGNFSEMATATARPPW